MRQVENDWNVTVIGNKDDEATLVPLIRNHGFTTKFVHTHYDPERISLDELVGKADTIVARESSVATKSGTIRPFLIDAKNYSGQNSIFQPIVVLLSDKTGGSDEISMNRSTKYMRDSLLLAYVHPGEYMHRQMIQHLFIANSRRAKWEQNLSDRILLVDDDPQLTAFFSDYVQSGALGDGVYLDVANSTLSAIEMLRKKDYRVAIFDKEIPGSKRMDVYDLTRWANTTFSFMQVMLLSGSTKSSDIEFFGSNLIKKGVLPEDVLEIALQNSAISKRKISDLTKDTHGHVNLILGGRGAGKSTFKRLTKIVLPFTADIKRPVSRKIRESDYEMEMEEHLFWNEDDIRKHENDPNWIVFSKHNNDGATYYAGINLSEVDYNLRQGKDVLLPLADPTKASILYDRYGSLVETFFIHNPVPHHVSELVSSRDEMDYTPAQVTEDLKKHSIIKLPFIVPNIVNPFNYPLDRTDQISMTKYSNIDNGVAIMCNKMMLNRQESKSRYRSSGRSKNYIRNRRS